MCFSDKVYNSDLSGHLLVEREAFNLCQNNEWSPFISLLAMSSVLGTRIHSHYPEFGEIKYRTYFNQCILPRKFYSSKVMFGGNILNVLLCRLTKEPSPVKFRFNHFVPMIDVQSRKHCKRLRPSPFFGNSSAPKRGFVTPKGSSNLLNYVSKSRTVFHSV